MWGQTEDYDRCAKADGAGGGYILTGRLGHELQADTLQYRPCLLDAVLPVEELAMLALREGWRPRPIYGAHRWFARRFGSAFRALLTAAALPEGADFWTAYYEGTDYWYGKTVLDPFVGGGTLSLKVAVGK